jgi:hypothetical protein
MSKNSKLYKVQTKVDAIVLNAITNKVNKENTTVSEYMRTIINDALISDMDIDTTAHIVGFNQSNNDKVTKINGPVAFKKTKLKTRGMI